MLADNSKFIVEYEIINILNKQGIRLIVSNNNDILYQTITMQEFSLERIPSKIKTETTEYEINMHHKLPMKIYHIFLPYILIGKSKLVGKLRNL